MVFVVTLNLQGIFIFVFHCVRMPEIRRELWSSFGKIIDRVTSSVPETSSTSANVASTQISLRWRHNDHAGVSNHQPHGCLLNRLFRRKSKKTSKLRVTGLCAGNSPGTGEFPAQMASYAENVSIWWRHHVIFYKKWTNHLLGLGSENKSPFVRNIKRDKIVFYEDKVQFCDTVYSVIEWAFIFLVWTAKYLTRQHVSLSAYGRAPCMHQNWIGNILADQ